MLWLNPVSSAITTLGCVKFRMPTLVYIVLLVSVLFNLIATVRSQRTCYYPDRSIAVNDQPCRPDANSPCCSSGWSCLENGICERTSLADRFNPNVTDYNYGRGSCTDRTWRSSECPLFCIGVGCTKYAP